MPRHSQHCTACEWAGDIIVGVGEHPPCPKCGGATERLWIGLSASIAGDEFPGGRTYENLGHDPVTVYSRSELRRELKSRGLEECVRHVPVPGSDKSPNTTSWNVPCEYTLRQAKALLERVGVVNVPAREERGGVGPHATPQLVKEIADSWH
jgi:hypothetical protein